jgi:hypothetical protein
MKEYRLDKTAFKARRHEDADKDNLFDRDINIGERLRIAFHLTCTIFGIKEGDSLKIDKTVFSARKFK